MAKFETKRNGGGLKSLSNYEVVVLAAYLLGGRAQSVDTEDIAIKSNEIAPGRFSWRKYKGQINIDYVRVALFDAQKNENGSYVTGSAKDGWQLTAAGAAFCDEMMKVAKDVDLSRDRGDRKEQMWARRERIRLLNEVAYQKFDGGNVEDVTLAELERFFRIDDYVIGNAREARLRRILNLFGQDPKLGKAVLALAKMLPTK